MAHPDYIAWLDTETTGLDEATGHLLEVAILITDNDLNEVAEPFNMIVQPAEGWKEDLNEFTTKMHTDNGLITDIDAGTGEPLAVVEAAAVEYIERLCGTQDKPMMGGNSITFDRTWLKTHMPKLLAAFHYRSIDATTLDQFTTRCTTVNGADPEQYLESDHRAVADLRRSVHIAKLVRDNIDRAFAPYAG